MVKNRPNKPQTFSGSFANESFKHLSMPVLMIQEKNQRNFVVCLRGFVDTAYNTYCPKDTARQLDSLGGKSPELGKIFSLIRRSYGRNSIIEKSRGQSFVEHVLNRMKNDSAFGAALRRADNPATESQAWEYLASWCDLDKDWDRRPFETVAAAIAVAKPTVDGFLELARR